MVNGLNKYNKKGQVVIFVILAIVSIAIIAVFFVFPDRLGISTGEVNPSSFLIGCIEPELEESLDLVSKQGGYLEPTNYISYQGDRIQYLCYTSNNYEPCKVQQPLLVSHIESELESVIQPRARECIRNLEAEYERRGFSVQTTPGEVDVELKSGTVDVVFNSVMTVSKEETQRYEKFGISLESELYDLVLTATSIISFESTLGDAETLSYVQYYPDLRIEKINREDYTIYKLSNIVSGDEFVFASRSLVWPPGFGELD